jgi:hypothetical protein
MKAINYLKQIKKMDAKIDADIEELATLEALATKTTAAMGDERVQSSGSQQKMEAAVIKIVALKDKITDEIDRFIEYKDQARQLVHDSCDEDCISLLTKRYFGVYDSTKGRTVYKTWEQIAVELSFSYQWVSDGLHQRALSQLQKALDEREE